MRRITIRRGSAVELDRDVGEAERAQQALQGGPGAGLGAVHELVVRAGRLGELLRGGGVDLLLLVRAAVEQIADRVDDTPVGAVDVAGLQVEVRRGDLRLREVDGRGSARVVHGDGAGGQV